MMTAATNPARAEHPAVYRPDIDGLRAIAVGVVLLYHAQLMGVTGGYVGVDVFFVLSGFLITQILARECAGDRYSIPRFYERRIRRILPALLLTLVLTMALGSLLLVPVFLADVGKTVLATLGFVSNVKFWRGNGYFGTPAELQPLLHTWSLAIEEQFYILWPLVLILLIGGNRKRMGAWIIWAGFVASLALSIAGAWLAPAATFLLLPTRAWELMCGAMLALDMVPRLTTARSRTMAGAIGLAAILIPCFAYTETTLFPGLAAVPPCLGSALLVQAGRDGDHAVGTFLSRPFMVAVGLISYSLYLVHFPILAFARLGWGAPLPAWMGVLVLVACAGLGYLSWRYVEQPFRDRARFPARRLLLWAGIGTALTAMAALALWLSQGLPRRFDPQAIALANAANDFDAESRQCIGSDIVGEAAAECIRGTRPPTTILWGDSHSAALFPALADALSPDGVRLVATGACPPLLDHIPPSLAWRDGKACRRRNREALDALAASPVGTTIVITAFWPTYRTALADRRDRASLLATTASNLDRLKGHRVVVLLDTPTAAFALPANLALDRHWGRSPTLLDAHRDDPVEAVVREAAAGRAEVYSLADALCPAPGPCAATVNGRPILSDANHLAAGVARQAVAPWLRERLRSGRSVREQ